MGGATRTRECSYERCTRDHECLTRDHESLREIWGGGCLRVGGGRLVMAAVVGTGGELTVEGRIGGHGGHLADLAAVGAGGGVLAGGRWVGTYSCCVLVQHYLINVIYWTSLTTGAAVSEVGRRSVHTIGCGNRVMGCGIRVIVGAMQILFMVVLFIRILLLE